MAVADLVQPLAVGRSGVDQGGDPERRHEDPLTGRQVQVLPVDLAPDEGRERVLGPPPIANCLREELQLLGRRREAELGLTVNVHGRRAVADERHVAGDVVQRLVGTGRARPTPHPVFVAIGADQVDLRYVPFVHLYLVSGKGERPLAPHVLQRREALGLGRLRKAGNRPLEEHRVVLVEGQWGSRVLPALELGPDAQRAVRVDAPRQVDPELLFLPHLARVGFVGALEHLAVQLAVAPGDRLAEPDPPAVVGLETGYVVALRGMPHGEHVVGEPRRFVPGRRQRHMAADLLRVPKHLHPGETVGIGPQRVVDAGEVGVQRGPPGFQEVGQQDRQLMVGERVLDGPLEFVPTTLGFGVGWGNGDELVPAVGVGPTLGAHRASQHVQELEAPGHHPATLVARRRSPPGV